MGTPSGSDGDCVLYVATDLETWEGWPPLEPDQDAICERAGFRRLEPRYYAWLHCQMERARGACRAGHLPAPKWEQFRQRFRPIQAWAVEHFGEEALLAAVESLDPERYVPPRLLDPGEPLPEPEPPPHLYPAEGEWHFTEPVPLAVVAKVDAIREQALALGWSEAELYQNRSNLRFPVGGEYGLACFVRGRCRVGEVTPQYIEIISPTGTRSRFYKPGAGFGRPPDTNG